MLSWLVISVVIWGHVMQTVLPLFYRNFLVFQSPGPGTTRTPFCLPVLLSQHCIAALYKVPTISSRRIKQSSISTRITTIDSSSVDISVTSLEAIFGLFSFVFVCVRVCVCICKVRHIYTDFSEDAKISNKAVHKDKIK
jgi:predicted secreted protein